MWMMMKLHKTCSNCADLSFNSSLIRSTGVLLYCHIKYAKRENRCIFHEVYQLINPNITSSHLKRNSKTSFFALGNILRAKIFYVESVFIIVYFTPYQFHATYHITTI